MTIVEAALKEFGYKRFGRYRKRIND